MAAAKQSKGKEDLCYEENEKNAFVCTVHASDRDDVPNHGIRKRGSQNVEVRRAFAESRRRSRQRYGD